MSVIEATDRPESTDAEPSARNEVAEIIDLLHLLTKHVEFQRLCLQFTDVSLNQIRESLSALG